LKDSDINLKYDVEKRLAQTERDIERIDSVITGFSRRIHELGARIDAVDEEEKPTLTGDQFTILAKLEDAVNTLRDGINRYFRGDFVINGACDTKAEENPEPSPIGKDRNGTDLYKGDDFAHCSTPKIIHKANRVVDGILIASDGTMFGFEWVYLVNAGPNNPNYKGE
jgi:hypothetical protein